MFISEVDIIWKDPEPEPIPVPGEKKKKKKVVEEPLKMYAAHKYEFAAVGDQKLNLTNNLVDVSQDAISLSYFTRPGSTA